jgi:hypothetical protein
MTRMLIVLCTLLTMIVLSSAQAEEPTVITLSCDGTTKVYVKREESNINPVTKMGVVVNLAERTVSFDGRVAHIDHVDAAVIYFGGDSVKDTTGYIDGKTGSMMATNMDGHKYDELYELVCPAATGAFSGLHNIAASDSGKVEITQRREGVSAHDGHKMKKAARASMDRPVPSKKKMKKSKSKT